MHIRGSSRKDNIDFKQELQVFLLHEDHLYWWVEGRPDLKFVIKIDCDLMQPRDENTLYIKSDLTLNPEDLKKEGIAIPTDDLVLAEEIKMIRINFSKFEIIPVYREVSITDHMVQFFFDKCYNKFIFILKCS